VDEFGGSRVFSNSTLIAPLPFTLGPDPSGGLANWNVLIFNLPFQGQQGDVLITDPWESGSPVLDVLRFDGNSHLIFYSDSIDGFNDPADTPGPPDPFYPNYVLRNELVSGKLNYVDYQPGAGEPGGDPAFGGFNPTYHIVSEIPEPGSAMLLLSALGVLGLARGKRVRASRNDQIKISTANS